MGTDADPGRVALMACEDAMKYMDGREMFAMQSDGQIVSLMNRKCIALAFQDPDQKADDAAVKLAFTDCDGAEGDSLDRLAWRLTPQNTLRALNLPYTDGFDQEVHDMD